LASKLRDILPHNRLAWPGLGGTGFNGAALAWAVSADAENWLNNTVAATHHVLKWLFICSLHDAFGPVNGCQRKFGIERQEPAYLYIRKLEEESIIDFAMFFRESE
jgi:hypothetical protein